MRISDWGADVCSSDLGHPLDRRAQAEARRRGTDISTLRARQLSADDFYDFDLILAADETNLRDARAIRPADATADLRLMLDLIPGRGGGGVTDRSEEHTSELQSLMRISYAVFCLKKKHNTDTRQ